MSTPIDVARRATVRQLANGGMSNRAIARQLGVHHNTVARDLAATAEPDEPADEPDEPRHEPEPEPDEPAAAPQDAPPHEPDEPRHEPDEPHAAPPPPTSGARRAPQLIHELPGWLIQDLNLLIDRSTGRLPEPVARAIHTAAEECRAAFYARRRANAEQRASQTSHDTAPAQ
ncbi:helix-turn-helix domain-containing protein [Streptomyces sp. NPDC087317]|uniref:helix-turn-helix domain-containing protein n=1 Tax=Streptomyces sp. NPDC087317 TaxID=3365784 RepID=UPI003802667C